MPGIRERYFHNRNYGCRIREFVHRGIGMVSLENRFIRITVLADKGTDIWEILYKPLDLDVMWHSFNDLKSPASFVPTRENPGGSFLDYYEGGWQELFPGIGEACEYHGAMLGAHGEVCLLPWKFETVSDTPEEVSVRFRVRTPRSPYLLEKTITVQDHAAAFTIEESVHNEGGEELQFMWGHHPAFGPLFLDDSCRIEVPPGSSARTTPNRLGPYGVLPPDTPFAWPSIQGLDGRLWDVSKVPPADSRIFQMFYLHDLPEGRYGLYNGNYGIRFTLRWDRKRFPILWVWAPYGGAMDYPWYGRNYNLALEPWSAIPANLARVAEQNRGIHIAPGQTIETRLVAEITAGPPEPEG